MIRNVPRLCLAFAVLSPLGSACMASEPHTAMETGVAVMSAFVRGPGQIGVQGVLTYASSSGEKGAVQDTNSPLRRAARPAMEDLAKRLGVKVNEIAVVRVEEVDWPDGSLGCPQPGMQYKQMLVNGTFIQLKVGDRLYNYHAGGGRPPFLCTSKDEVLPEHLRGVPRRDPRT